MSKHEHIKQLCALAAIGELAPEHKVELDTHLVECHDCHQAYVEYTGIQRDIRLVLDQADMAFIESAQEPMKKAVLRGMGVVDEERRALTRISAEKTTQTGPGWLRLVWVGGVAVFLLGSAFLLGARHELHQVQAAKLSEPGKLSEAVKASITTEGLDEQEKKALEARAAKLESQLSNEWQQNGALHAELLSKDEKLAAADRDHAALQQQLQTENSAMDEIKALLTEKAERLKQLETAKSSDTTTLAALQVEVHDLRQKLDDQQESIDRERDLLAKGREVRDILGARNLHIIDVYDTDVDGTTKKPFARAFYTEGKSLVYYAYDLPVRRVENGQYQYVAWGESRGKKSSLRSLGLLLNDDRTQRRWVLDFSDPKVLAEIDSVFITLELAGTETDVPKGKRMLTAYLADQANHP